MNVLLGTLGTGEVIFLYQPVYKNNKTLEQKVFPYP
jgi:hypothetical protein